MTQHAFITGLAGHTLPPAERDFLRASRPAGLILFARNVDTPDQVRRLIAEACAAIGTSALVLVDQEGGRVQRLRPPHWRTLPSGANYAARFAVDPTAAVLEAKTVARLVAHDLSLLGFNCNCVPVLDVLRPETHAVIGTRALGGDTKTIVALGCAIADGHLAGGVLPVMKHIPGHGRATLDTHLALPTVTAPEAELQAADFAPFKALASHIPAAMTAHVVFSAIDGGGPASTSKVVHQRVIRGHVSFDGLLMSDDLSMQALSGQLGQRAAAVIAAGTDLALHCNGVMAEMEQVAAHVPKLAGKAAERFKMAISLTGQHTPFSMAEAEACLTRFLGVAPTS